MNNTPQDEERKPDLPTAPKKKAAQPAAGPHARKDLTNPMATPGAGTMPDVEGNEGDGISG